MSRIKDLRVYSTINWIRLRPQLGRNVKYFKRSNSHRSINSRKPLSFRLEHLHLRLSKFSKPVYAKRLLFWFIASCYKAINELFNTIRIFEWEIIVPKIKHATTHLQTNNHFSSILLVSMERDILKICIHQHNTKYWNNIPLDETMPSKGCEKVRCTSMWSFPHMTSNDWITGMPSGLSIGHNSPALTRVCTTSKINC